jgi:nucleoside-diphosphate-sugar epimerase
LQGEGVILFGGSGFLGHYILENYPNIISVGRTPPRTANRHIQVDNIADLDGLHGVPFEKVIFIIGHSDRENMEKEHLLRGEPMPFDYHVVPLIQVLEQLKQYPLKKFIHFSTVLLYDPKKITLPVSAQGPIDPYQNRYILSKHMAEEACRFYARWLPIINVRLSNIYGPWPRQRFDLIHKLTNQLLESGKGQVWSTKPARDFVYVEDAAHFVVKLLETGHTGTVNLGTGTMTPVRTIVEVLRKISGCEISDLDQPVGGPMQFGCDMNLINQLIDWQPQFSIEEGLRRTFELMKSWNEC